ncbi:hypothetical protein R1sor_013456 [Riccia sorocarpa]|uniref:DDE Tnp4 domain-containing protein n=1 Tax=Riccia sorocarpa TaxID=122646 RepID=A0ABD3H9J0_9MARC
MSKDSFYCILDMIGDHNVFHNNSPKQQALVFVQLAVALDRIGHEGNEACLDRSMLLWGISHGSMVNYTNRVMIALESCLGHEIAWPDRQGRAAIAEHFAALGFQVCVGLVDGTLVKLSQRPRDNGKMYFDRKSNYSLNVQVICDQNKRAIYFLLGGPTCTASICRTAMRAVRVVHQTVINRSVQQYGGPSECKRHNSVFGLEESRTVSRSARHYKDLSDWVLERSKTAKTWYANDVFLREWRPIIQLINMVLLGKQKPLEVTGTFIYILKNKVGPANLKEDLEWASYFKEEIREEIKACQKQMMAAGKRKI